MLHKHVPALCALLLLFNGLTYAAEPRNPRPLQRAIDEYSALFAKRDYARLEKLSTEVRANKTPLSDGQPALGAIYTATNGCNCPTESPQAVRTRHTRLQEWHKRFPNSISARIALALQPLREGWQARGAGPARTVTADGWRVFRESMEKSRVALEALGDDAKGQPDWFEAMLDVGISEGWPRERFMPVFEQGMAKHPGYLPLYFQRTYYEFPQPHAQAAQFGRMVADLATRTQETFGESLYARLVWAHATDDLMKSGRVSWNRMKAGFERIVGAFPDPWNINSFGRLACGVSDWTVVSHVIQSIQHKPIVAAWGGREFYDACANMVARQQAQQK